MPVEFLIGFRNKGDQDFIVDAVDASFRYPMDFNFYIQNFSAVSYNKVIAPQQDATFHYSFIPSESFASRPFGLNINLMYHDFKGNIFQEAVFNETVQIQTSSCKLLMTFKIVGKVKVKVNVIFGRKIFHSFQIGTKIEVIIKK